MAIPSRKRTRVRWVAIGLLICLGYTAYIFVDQERQLNGLRREADDLRAKEATLKAENEQLSQEQQQLQSDTYIEKLAREELGLVKPGETPYIMGQQNSLR